MPNINRLTAAMREAGSSVWWVRAIYGDDAPKTWTAYMKFASPEFSGDMLGALTEGAEGAELWHGLDIQRRRGVAGSGDRRHPQHREDRVR